VTWIKHKLISIRLEIVLISVQDRCMVCDKSTTGMEIALGTPDSTRGNICKWKLVLVRLEIELVLVQDRCTVCVERTIVLKSFWSHPMVLLGDVGQVEARFGLFGDSVNLSAR
jgi:hypothetical protein